MLAIVLTVAFTACGNMDAKEINVATLNGPTGIGMVQLMDDYNVEVYQSPTDVAAKVLKGDCDIAALPSNMAAVLYNKSKGNIVELATIAMGNLYIVQNGNEKLTLESLKNKTIIASGQGGTPEFVLKKIAPEANVKWIASHADVVQAVMKNDGAIGMIPEPFVSTALAQNDNINIAFDLNDLWKDATGEELPMGVLVATKAFADEHSSDIDAFLDVYEESVDFVNDASQSADLVVEKGFFANEKLAEKAIPGCKIVLNRDKKVIENFYEQLFDLNPKSIGGKLPDEEFFY